MPRGPILVGACLLAGLLVEAAPASMPESFDAWKTARKQRLLAEAARKAGLAMRVEAGDLGFGKVGDRPDLLQAIEASENLRERKPQLELRLAGLQEQAKTRFAAVEAGWDQAVFRHATLQLASAPNMLPDGAGLRRLLLWGLLALAAGLAWAQSLSTRPRRPRWQTASFGLRLMRGSGLVLAGLALLGVVVWLAFGLWREGRAVLFSPPGIVEQMDAIWVKEAAEEKQALEATTGSLASPEDVWMVKVHGKNAVEQMAKLLILDGQATALLADGKQLEAASNELEAARSKPTMRVLSALGRAAPWLLVMGCALGPWIVVWARGWLARRANLAACPRCLAGRVVSESAKKAAGRSARMPDKLACRKCDFKLPVTMRAHYRLAFPTVGVVDSGKTHFLVELYQRVRQKHAPKGVRLDCIETESPQAVKFAQFVADMRRSYQGTSATPPQREIPDPLLFDFSEGNGLPDGALLNVFDFAGELADMSIHTHELRRRALAMDGFLLVLDPTKPPEPQRIALAAFCQELREVRGIWPSQPIPVPIAVCLTKIDLLAGATDMGDAGLEWLEKLRVMPRDTLDESVLDRKSDMAEDIIGELFAPWDVRRTLAENFGANVRYFPLTPVGIDDDNERLSRLKAGKQSLIGRGEPAPFGVFEPILWLLHMHGYDVFRNPHA